MNIFFMLPLPSVHIMCTCGNTKILCPRDEQVLISNGCIRPRTKDKDLGKILLGASQRVPLCIVKQVLFNMG